MKKIFYILLFGLVSSWSFGQKQLVKQANELKAKYAFADAAELYEKAVANGMDSAAVAASLAECYWQQRDLKQAARWYAVVVMHEPTPKQILNYALSLKSLERYEEADAWLERYDIVHSDDRIVKKHREKPDYFFSLRAHPDRFELTESGVNTENSEFSATYWEDQVVFVSSRRDKVSLKRTYSWNNEAYLDLYVAELDPNGLLRDAVPFDKHLNSKVHEGPVSFTPTGRRIYFTRNDPKSKKRTKDGKVNNLKIYYADKVEGGWSEPVPFKYNSDNYSIGHPTLSADGKTMYVVSDMDGGFGETDLYVCRLDTDGSWTQPENLGHQINTSGHEMFPYLHPDGTLYFASDGHVGLGGLDIFEAHQHEGIFYSVANMEFPINSEMDDFGLIIDANKRRGFISTNRKMGNPQDDLFMIKRKANLPLLIEGTVVDLGTGKQLEGAKVTLYGENNEEVETQVVGPNGAFKFDLDKDHCGYRVFIENGDTWSTFSSTDSPCDVDEGILDLGEVGLSRMEWGVEGTMFSLTDDRPMEGFTVTLLNTDNGQRQEKLTPPTGKVAFAIEPDQEYMIRFAKEGYFTKVVPFSTKDREPGIISITEFEETEFEKVELNKAIELENILYDYNSAEIRPDAAKELDKLVKMMLANPSMYIELGSHTDARGDDEYNQKLSERRAKSAVEYIISQGVEPSMMIYKGYGESELRNHCGNGIQCTEVQHQENRRTEFKVLYF